MFTQLAILVAFLWAGMILGISFLESWVKFRAPSITRPIGLDIGRTVFNYFHKVQYGIAILLILISFAAHMTMISCLLLSIITILLYIQSACFLKQLNERASIIIAGGSPAPSHVHAYYGIAEIVKFIFLVLFGMVLLIAAH